MSNGADGLGRLTYERIDFISNGENGKRMNFSTSLFSFAFIREL